MRRTASRATPSACRRRALRRTSRRRRPRGRSRCARRMTSVRTTRSRRCSRLQSPRRRSGPRSRPRIGYTGSRRARSPPSPPVQAATTGFGSYSAAKPRKIEVAALFVRPVQYCTMTPVVADNFVEREKTLRDFGRPERAGLYVPRVLQQHLADDPLSEAWSQEGTAVFADVSGFTKLSEALAQKGREGAEQITDAIEKVFGELLGIAYERGGTLLKFGGDALLLWFDGDEHALRACGTAARMREALANVGVIVLPGVDVTLRISQGVHTGTFDFFVVGTSHHELLTVGPEWTRLAAAETCAGADQIVVSSQTASLLPKECVGESVASGNLLVHEPAHPEKVAAAAPPKLATETISRCL